MKRTIALILLGTLITSDSATLIAAEEAWDGKFHCPSDGCTQLCMTYQSLKNHHALQHPNSEPLPQFSTFIKPPLLVQQVFRVAENPIRGKRQRESIEDFLERVQHISPILQDNSDPDSDDDDKNDSSTSSSSSSSSSSASIPTRPAPPRLTYTPSNSNKAADEEGEHICPVLACQQVFTSEQDLTKHIKSIHPQQPL